LTDELQIVWAGEMAFTAHTASGHTLNMDATLANGGQNAAPQPLELLLVSLAACSAMDVLGILKKKRQPIERLSVRVRHERAADYPRVYTAIRVEYVVRGTGVQRAAVERAIELTETKYCPVHAMLAPTVAISHSYTIEESGDAG
jgi:putative redox protein